MKLKMLVSLAGVDFSLSPNEETDRFDEVESQRLVDAGFAELVTGADIERAVKKPVKEKRG